METFVEIIKPTAGVIFGAVIAWIGISRKNNCAVQHQILIEPMRKELEKFGNILVKIQTDIEWIVKDRGKEEKEKRR